MEFCSKCDNLYALQISDEKKLTYYCKNCGNEETNLNETNLCISKIYTKENNNSFIINEYTKYDPTLPHVHNVKCPNTYCNTHKDGSKLDNDVIYIRSNLETMDFIYLCCYCDTNWKLN